MLWKKKKSDVGLPDLPPAPTALPTMKNYTPSQNPREYVHKDESNDLPSFPDSPMKKGFSQSAIKDAVTTEDTRRDLPQLPEFPEDHEQNENSASTNKEYKVIEMEEWKPQLPPSLEHSGTSHHTPPPIPHKMTLEAPEDHDSVPPPPELELAHIEPPHHEIHPPEQTHAHIQETIAPKRNTARKQIYVKLNKFQAARNSLETIKEKLSDVDDLLKKMKEVKRQEDEELSFWEREIISIKARINSVSTEIFENVDE